MSRASPYAVVFWWLFCLHISLANLDDAASMIDFIQSHPQRAYFSRLFRDGSFRTGVEVGVASGRFSEHITTDGLRVSQWQMIEPYPSRELKSRISKLVAKQPETQYELIVAKSLDAIALEKVGRMDFIYLDGSHNYDNVKQELVMYYARVRPGGILAGHDYCNYGESPLSCLGCDNVPICGNYTKKLGRAANQAGVVRAVQEWLVESHPYLRLFHTAENFTRDSIARDGMSYDLILTTTRNPSWYVVKPLRVRKRHPPTRP